MGRIGDEYGIGAFQRSPYLARAARALNEGRFEEAEVLADEALRVFTETGHRSAFAFYAAVLIGIRRDQGRLAELVPLLAQTVQDNPNLPGAQAASAWCTPTSTSPRRRLRVLHDTGRRRLRRPPLRLDVAHLPRATAPRRAPGSATRRRRRRSSSGCRRSVTTSR